MKLTNTLLLIIGIVSVMAATPALAQNSFVVTANVPYSFQAGEARLTAGLYRVEYDAASRLLRIRNEETRRGIIINTQQPRLTGDSERCELQFNVYGDKYYLASVWTPFAKGRIVGTSKAERESAKAATEPVHVAVVKALH
jgi:hypothetical protein